MAWSKRNITKNKITIGQRQTNSEYCSQKSDCKNLPRTSKTRANFGLKKWNYLKSFKRVGSNQRGIATVKRNKSIKLRINGMYIWED